MEIQSVPLASESSEPVTAKSSCAAQSKYPLRSVVFVSLRSSFAVHALCEPSQLALSSSSSQSDWSSSRVYWKSFTENCHNFFTHSRILIVFMCSRGSEIPAVAVRATQKLQAGCVF